MTLGNQERNPRVDLQWHHTVHKPSGRQGQLTYEKPKNNHSKKHHPRGGPRKSEWETDARNNRHPKWPRPLVPNHCNHCCATQNKALQRLHHPPQPGHKTSLGGLVRTATNSAATPHSLHRPYPCPGRLQQVLRCLQGRGRGHVVWTKPGPTTNCVEGPLPSRNPGRNGIRSKSERKNL